MSQKLVQRVEEGLLRACPDCDKLHRIPTLPSDTVAKCIRCGAILEKNNINSYHRSLALATTGVILFVISNLFPLLLLKAQGLEQAGTLIGATISMYNDGRPILSVVVFLTTFLFPLFSLVSIIFILIVSKRKAVNIMTSGLFRAVLVIESWSMLEVFLLSIIVTGVKLGDVAQVVLGPSAYAFISMIIVITWLQVSLNQRDVWHGGERHIV